ncbi:MAG: ABC transporter ATP-binding protein [Deltaproteobacteria bacterium]|nr:ABC transporter ATP-binding protein [Deltaproteobacteria bacterium]
MNVITSPNKIIEIKDLNLRYQTLAGEVYAINHVSLWLEKGQALGLVGESGCGKTTLAMAIMGLLPKNVKVTGGQILFHQEDLLGKTREEMRKIRWRHISMIFQGAMNVLNPVQRVGDQIVEAILAHMDLSRDDARDRVADLYDMVDLDPKRIDDYPHQYSGGMKQRAVIAMALACSPDLVIADEPTTALDVMVQHQILDELNKLRNSLEMSLIYISHDISIIAETCGRVGVMYAGSLMEHADAVDLFANPRHPYTKGLLSSYPSLLGEKKRLNPIPGEPPNLLEYPNSCIFSHRCPEQDDVCRRTLPELREVAPGHLVYCHRA